MKFKTLLLSALLVITTLSLSNCSNFSDPGCTSCACKNRSIDQTD